MTVHEDYSREAWSRRRRESSGEERPPRRYQYWETPHGHRPRVRRVNYLFIFWSLRSHNVWISTANVVFPGQSSAWLADNTWGGYSSLSGILTLRQNLL